MATPVTFFPKISTDIPWEVRQHLQLIYGKLNNHALAFGEISKATAGTVNNTTIENITSGGGGGGGGGPIPGLGGVNNQTGNTSYVTAVSDNGVTLILDDASPVAVTLNSGVSSPWMIFATNLGVGLVTLTPSSGTINGSATFLLPTMSTSIISFDGTNWWATAFPIVPLNTPAVAHQWLASYNAATGAFTQTQPAFTDISGVATTVQIGTGSPAAGKYVDGGTGAWTTLPTGGVNFADDETPAGLINSSNVTYTLAHPPSPAGSLILVLAGLTQAQGGGLDYTLSTNTITFTSAPTLGPLIAWYRF